ncbi:MAG: DUF4185 domain-containing protein [Acutalibacteraceae bacterium]
MRVVFSALALAVLVLSSGCSVAGDEEITFDEDGEETVSLTPAEKMRQEAEDLLAVLVEKNVSYAPLEDPEGVYNLNTVKNVHMVEMLTGEYAQNHTKTNYGVGGTDLGVMINKGEETFIFFGDTFLNETQSENWRSNVAAVTTDIDYTDGIVFDRMICTGTGVAKELLRGKKKEGDEVTKIPTGGICIGDTLYLSYMSVRQWGASGLWDCNYGSVAKSTDDGETWEQLETLRWPGDSQFCQMYPVVVDDMIYVPGISGGRDGSAALMRVPVAEYENIDAYEYLVGLDENGEPLFEKGEGGMRNASVLLEKPVGEMSFLYSTYLEEWIVTYISDLDIIVRSAKSLWGPYSEPVTVAKQVDFPGLYGAFMNPRYVSEDGKKIGFLMSLWSPVYNVAVMEMELER